MGTPSKSLSSALAGAFCLSKSIVLCNFLPSTSPIQHNHNTNSSNVNFSHLDLRCVRDSSHLFTKYYLIFPTTRQKTPSSNNTRDGSLHGHHQMVNSKIKLILQTIYMINSKIKLILQTIYIFVCRQRWRSSMWSAKTRPGAGCGSDYELCIAK